MKILVERFEHTKDWTLSRVYVDGVFSFFGVEDEFREQKVRGETRIPEGEYILGIRYSPKVSPHYLVDSNFKLIRAKTATEEQKRIYRPHDVIWIKNVPDFEYILIHPGNTDLDSDGCLIIGDRLGVLKGRAAVLNSVGTYMRYYGGIVNKILSQPSTIEYKSINFR